MYAAGDFVARQSDFASRAPVHSFLVGAYKASSVAIAYNIASRAARRAVAGKSYDCLKYED
jgi:hypothetical protein